MFLFECQLVYKCRYCGIAYIAKTKYETLGVTDNNDVLAKFINSVRHQKVIHHCKSKSGAKKGVADLIGITGKAKHIIADCAEIEAEEE